MPRKNKQRKAGRGRKATQRKQGALGAPSSDHTVRGSISGGFTTSFPRTVGGTPDVTTVRLRYETTSAFTSTGGAASFVQIKGNSIYHPYVGNTDNPGGYARMYNDYQISTVVDCHVTVQLWGGVAGQDEPFRLVLVPCSYSQYSVYSGFSNVCQLWDVPHCKQATFSPGGKLPVLKARAQTAQVLLGYRQEDSTESIASETGYNGTTGADPTIVWYFLLGYQNFAGTTTTNQQAQVSIEYTVQFKRPIATPVQVTRNKFGNEEEVKDVRLKTPGLTTGDCKSPTESRGQPEKKSEICEESAFDVEELYKRARELPDPIYASTNCVVHSHAPAAGEQTGGSALGAARPDVQQGSQPVQGVDRGQTRQTTVSQPAAAAVATGCGAACSKRVLSMQQKPP